MAVTKKKSINIPNAEHGSATNKLLYHQIGLSYKHRFQLKVIVLAKLYNYGYNGPLIVDSLIGTDSSEPADDFATILETLAKHGIIIYKLTPDSRSYRIFVTNRYKLERIRAELNGTVRRNDVTRDDSIIYYDLKTGEMFCNGIRKKLKGRNKKLFDALYTSSPSHVSRSKLKSIARSGKYANAAPMYLLSEAFTNLRKVCGVSAKVIQLDSSGGRLNAYCYPLDSQLLPPTF